MRVWNALREELDGVHSKNSDINSSEGDHVDSHSGRRDLSIRGNSKVLISGIIGSRPIRQNRDTSARHDGGVRGSGLDRVWYLRHRRFPHPSFGNPVAD